MRTIYLRNMVRGYLKKKWLIIVGLVVFVLIFGFLGLRRAYPERMNSDLAEEIEEYNEELATYDDAIDGIKTNIDVAKEQLATQEEYCNNSIYMQIDPQNVQMASVQYILTAPNATSTTDENNLLTSDINAMNAYFKSGDFLPELTERLNMEDANYLSEIISFDSTGKTITLSVKHYDMEQAHEILIEMIDLIEAYKPEVEKQFGSFTMTSMGESERVYADSDVLTAQNKEKTNLRTYRTNLTDLQSKLTTQQNNRKSYIEQYAPSGGSSSPRRTIIRYGGMGVIAGIIVPILIYAVYYTLSSRIKGKEEIQAAGLSVLALYRPKKGYSPSLEKAVVNLMLLVEKNQTGRVSLCPVGESPALEQVETDLTGALEAENLKVYKTRQGTEDAEQLRQMSEIGNHVLIVEAGRSTYTQLEEQIQFCESLGIKIWGCVVIE